MNPLQAALNAAKGVEKKAAGIGSKVVSKVKGAINTRIQEQNNFEKQINSGNNKNYYGTASSFKNK